MPKQTAHFWTGTFESKSAFDTFFKTDSRFAKSQGERRIDPDFMESGFDDSDVPPDEKFAGYSYAAYWMAEFEQKLRDHEINTANTLVMYSFDKDYCSIDSPASFTGKGYAMKYLGKITFEYEHPDWFKKILGDI